MRNAFVQFLELLTRGGRQRRRDRQIAELARSLAEVTTRDNHTRQYQSLKGLLRIGSREAIDVIIRFGERQIRNPEMWPIVVYAFEDHPTRDARSLLAAIVDGSIARMHDVPFPPETIELVREVARKPRIDRSGAGVVQEILDYGWGRVSAVGELAAWSKFANRAADCLRACGGEPRPVPGAAALLIAAWGGDETAAAERRSAPLGPREEDGARPAQQGKEPSCGVGPTTPGVESYNRGVMLSERGEYAEAIEAFSECGRLGHLQVQSAYARILCERRMGLELERGAGFAERNDEVAAVFVATNLACYLIDQGHRAALTKQGCTSEVTANIGGSTYVFQISSLLGVFSNWVRRVEGQSTIPVADPDRYPTPSAKDRMVIALAQDASSLPLTRMPADGLATSADELEA
jgi:hypothetical protein